MAREGVQAFLHLERSSSAVADWLQGPYAAATRFGPQHTMTPSPDGEVASAQEEVWATVRGALRARSAGEIVRRLPPLVHILPAHDASGARGFIPINAKGGRLADRAVALVLADYLTRPEDFVACSYWVMSDAPPW